MGKKRKTKAFVLKPWCWYCEREFEDEKVLLQHQKSKHFKCQLCPRKLNTAGGLMVHSQQVHKCEPEPLTNTLPGRDGYDIEIFGMEGVPTNALAEWKARKEAEAGTAELAAAAAAKRPRQAYTVIPEADLMAALSQHKALMATRDKPGSKPAAVFQPPVPPFPPMGFPSFPPPGFPPGMPPPSFPPGPAPSLSSQAPPQFIPEGMPPPTLKTSSAVNAITTPGPEAEVVPPKDGVMWPDSTASPAEKRALQPRYRYLSPTPGDGEDMELGRKRKAAADFL